MEGFCLALMALAAVAVVAGPDDGVVHVVVAAMDDASNPDVDEANAEKSVIVVEVTCDEVASGDCTYLSIVAEHSYQLDYFSTDSKVRQKFLPLALR